MRCSSQLFTVVFLAFCLGLCSSFPSMRELSTMGFTYAGYIPKESSLIIFNLEDGCIYYKQESLEHRKIETFRNPAKLMISGSTKVNFIDNTLNKKYNNTPSIAFDRPFPDLEAEMILTTSRPTTTTTPEGVHLDVTTKPTTNVKAKVVRTGDTDEFRNLSFLVSNNTYNNSTVINVDAKSWINTTVNLNSPFVGSRRRRHSRRKTADCVTKLFPESNEISFTHGEKTVVDLSKNSDIITLKRSIISINSTIEQFPISSSIDLNVSHSSNVHLYNSRKLLGLNFAQDLHGKSESLENEIFLKPVFNSSALAMLKPYDRNGSSTILRTNYLSKIDLTTNSDFKQIVNLLVKMEKENFLVGDYSECEVSQLDYPFQTVCENIRKTDCLKAFIYLKIEGHSLICHHAISWSTNDFSSPCERYTEPCYKNSTKYLFSNQEFKISASLRVAEKELPLFMGKNACGFYKTDCGEGSAYIEKYTKVWWWLDNFGLHYSTELDVAYKTLHDEVIGYSCVNAHLNVSSGCSGDRTYCEYFKCSVDTKCFCELDNSIVHISVKSSNMSSESPAWLLGESYEKLYYKVNSIKSVPFETGNMIVTCNKNIIKVENFLQDVSLIEVCIHPECIIAQNPKTSHDFYFNFDAFSQDVSVLVTITNSKSEENKIVKHCPKIDKCSNLPCYFCIDKVLAYDCYNKLEFIFASIVIGMLTSVFIAFVFWLFTLIKAFLLVFTGVLWGFKVLKFAMRILMNFFSPLKDIMFRVSGFCVKRKRREDEPLLPVNIKHVHNKELASSSSNSDSVKFRPRYKVLTKELLLIFCLLAVFVVGSVSGSAIVVPVGSMTCSGQNCKVSHDVLLSMPPLGQDIIIPILDPSQKISGRLIVTPLEFQRICRQKDLYYSFEPEVKPDTSSWCPGPNCNEDICKNFAKGVNYNAMDVSKKFLGFAICERVPTQRISSNCAFGLFASACVFSKLEILNAKQKNYKAVLCPEWSPRLKFKIRYDGLSKSDFQEEKILEIYPSAKIDLPNLSISLISALEPAVSFPKCFLLFDDFAIYDDCSSPGNPSPGFGEVQCKSPSDQHSASESCLFSRDIVYSRSVGDGLTWNQKDLIIDKAREQNSLPLKTGGVILTFNSSDQSLILKTKESTVVNLMLTLRNFGVTRYEEEVSCVISGGSISGCVNCKRGAKVKVTGYSSNKNTMISLDCGSFITSIVIPDKKSFETGEFGQEDVFFSKLQTSFTCMMNCGGKLSSVELSAELTDELNPIPYTSITRLESEAEGRWIDSHSISETIMRALFSSIGHVTSGNILVKAFNAMLILISMYLALKILWGIFKYEVNRHLD